MWKVKRFELKYWFLVVIIINIAEFEIFWNFWFVSHTNLDCKKSCECMVYLQFVKLNRKFYLPLKIVWAIGAYSRSLLRAIIARNHLLSFKIFSNFVHFCPNFQIFCLFFALFCSFFCPFFEKIACMPLLSRIGPGDRWHSVSK